MKCPECGREASLVGCDYGSGWVNYRCYGHGEYNFSSNTEEAQQESARSREASAANAEAIRRRREG